MRSKDLAPWPVQSSHGPRHPLAFFLLLDDGQVHSCLRAFALAVPPCGGLGLTFPPEGIPLGIQVLVQVPVKPSWTCCSTWYHPDPSTQAPCLITAFCFLQNIVTAENEQAIDPCMCLLLISLSWNASRLSVPSAFPFPPPPDS